MKDGGLDPPLYAYKYKSKHNGTFYGSFIFLKMNAKNGNFPKMGKVP